MKTEIDGSIGGGQVLRTALGLSCLFKKPFHITNIRKNRPNPGLQEQHLQCILAASKLSNAEVKGAYKGSQEIYFSPQEIKNTSLEIKISTAGSVGLVLQSLLIIGFKYPLEIKIVGGATYGKWAPSVDFIDKVFCFWLRKIGMQIDIKVSKHGFYPKGDALVEVKIIPKDKYESIFIEKINQVKKFNLIAVASENLKKRDVLERMVKKAKDEIKKKFDLPVDIEMIYQKTSCDGCGLTIYTDTLEGVIGSSLCGEKGKTAEEVAQETIDMVLYDLAKNSLDRFTADQIIPYLALLKGKVRIPFITDHIRSNIEVVKKFIPGEFIIEENYIEVK